MSKTYTISQTVAETEQKTIVSSEEVTETKEEKFTIAQLKEEHAKTIQKIEALKRRADEIVDQLFDVETKLSLEISEKPKKVSDGTAINKK